MAKKSGRESCGMTIGEKLHKQREKECSKWLKEWDLSLYKQGGLYQIVDDFEQQPLTDLIPLSEVIEIIEAQRR